MNQIWKDIKGFEGLYQVSNLGRVKSLKYKGRNEEGILRPGREAKGYFKLSLHKKGCKTKTVELHRLVFETFYRRLLPNEHCHHINSIQTDNRAINLVGKDASLHEKEHNKKKDPVTGRFQKKG